MQLVTNEMGLIEVSGNESDAQQKENNITGDCTDKSTDNLKQNKPGTHSSDSDNDSDSIDLTCKEDAPSSPSKQHRVNI